MRSRTLAAERTNTTTRDIQAKGDVATPHVLTDSTAVAVGWRSGSRDGMRTHVALLPEGEVGVVVITTRSGPVGGSATWRGRS